MRRYGEWAGNPNGTAEDPNCCIVKVAMGGRSGLFRQCDKKRGDDGLCGTHRRMKDAGKYLSIPKEKP